MSHPFARVAQSAAIALGVLCASPAFPQSSGSQADAAQIDDAQDRSGSSDRALAARVTNALAKDQTHYYRHVTVSASKGVVTLGGFVTGAASLARAKQIAAGVPGVSKVVDQMQLQPEGEQGPGTK
jgi:osmotically-inducible protein OsmY